MDLKENIEFECDLTVEDMKHVTYTYFKKYKIVGFFMLFPIVFMIAMSILLIMLDPAQSPVQSEDIIGMMGQAILGKSMFIALGVGFFILVIHLGTKRSYQAHKKINGTMHYIISNDTLQVITKSINGVIEWKDIESYEVTKKAHLLSITVGQSYILPKRLFDTETNEMLTKFLSKKIKNKKRKY